MKTTKAAAREWLNQHYPETRKLSLEWAIKRARQAYASDEEYFDSLNQEEMLP